MSFVLGGLLSGLGAGMNQAALYDREAALENLRNQRAVDAEGRQNTEWDRRQGTLNEQEIAKEGRAIDAYKTKAEVDLANDKEKLGVAADITEKSKESDFGREVTLAQIKSNLNIKEGSASEADRRATIRMEKALENGDVSQFVVNDAGEYVGLTKNGGTVSFGVKAKPDPLSKDQREAKMSYTLADAEYTAKQRGISVEEVHKQMKKNGYRLTR